MDEMNNVTMENETSMKENRVDFGVTNYVENNDALNNFIDGFERSVLLRFNCDGVIIDKI